MPLYKNGVINDAGQRLPIPFSYVPRMKYISGSLINKDKVHQLTRSMVKFQLLEWKGRLGQFSAISVP